MNEGKNFDGGEQKLFGPQKDMYIVLDRGISPSPWQTAGDCVPSSLATLFLDAVDEDRHVTESLQRVQTEKPEDHAEIPILTKAQWQCGFEVPSAKAMPSLVKMSAQRPRYSLQLEVIKNRWRFALSNTFLLREFLPQERCDFLTNESITA